MTDNRERSALACFLASALLAGGNGVSIRFSNRELAPLWGPHPRSAGSHLDADIRSSPTARTGDVGVVLLFWERACLGFLA
jgi:hypothetical protein